MLLGPSRASALLLMATITALLAASVYWCIPRDVPRAVAFGCAAALVCSAYFQKYTASVMCEPLCCLLMFWAAICWGLFLERGGTRYSIGFGVCAALAILTKGNGLLLALVPGLTLLLTGRLELLRNPRFWYPPVIVLAACGPWYWFTLPMQRNGMQEESFSAEFVRAAVPYYSNEVLGLVGIVLALLAAVGVVVWKIGARAGRTNDGRLSALAS